MEKWIYYRGTQPLLCLPINDHYLQQEEFWEALEAFVKSQEKQRQKIKNSIEAETTQKNLKKPTVIELSQAILVPIPLPQDSHTTIPQGTNLSTISTKSTQNTASSTANNPYQRLVKETLQRIQHIPKNTALIFQTSGTSKKGGHLVGLSWNGIVGAIAAAAHYEQENQTAARPKVLPRKLDSTQLFQPNLTSTGKNNTSELTKPPLTEKEIEQTLKKLKKQEWILAIPAQHIGGFLVILRSLLAGKRPHILPLAEGFSITLLTTLIRQIKIANERKKLNTSIHISLVPTQIQRCLKNAEATQALKQLSQILIGGAATNKTLQEAINTAKIKAIYTYGMTETSGGCIYDGCPLPGSSIRLKDGRVYLKTTGLMTGYLDEAPGVGLVEIPGNATTEKTGVEIDRKADNILKTKISRQLGNQILSPTEIENLGEKWLKTNDLGQIKENYQEVKSGTLLHPQQLRLDILGRIDRVAVSGGKKIPLGVVQKAIEELENPQIIRGITENLLVTKIQDTDWGEIVTVAILTKNLKMLGIPVEYNSTKQSGESKAFLGKKLKDALKQLRKALSGTLPNVYLPRAIVAIEEIPLLPNGKIDQLTLEKQVAVAETLNQVWKY